MRVCMSKKAKHDSICLQLVCLLEFLNRFCNLPLLLISHSERNPRQKEIRIVGECLLELNNSAIKLTRMNVMPSQVLIDAVVERIQLESDLALSIRLLDTTHGH